ncbi:MAG: hypothetical protein K9K65_11745 [Desulfarculaceae bacterium]|nr:hypothetical protein [Desulfarculaceae bacterium]MCF8122319.1 hypothetical protein [Desulfarculaceae bacterium]
MELITWVLEHWTTILGLAAMAHFVAQIVVNVTPTPKDNAWLGRIYKAAEVAAGIVTRTAKLLPGEPQIQRRTQ